MSKKCINKCDSVDGNKMMCKWILGKKRLVNDLDKWEVFGLLLKIFKRRELNGYVEIDKVVNGMG